MRRLGIILAGLVLVGAAGPILVSGGFDGDLNGSDLICDADGDSRIECGTDDVISFYIDGSEELRLFDGYLQGIGASFLAVASGQLGFAGRSNFLSSADGTMSVVTSSLTSPSTLAFSVPVEASTAGSGAPNVLTSLESGKTLTNEGTTVLAYNTLPAAAAGLSSCFDVQDADGIRVTAAGDDTIRLNEYVSAAAGYIQSTQIGATTCVKAVNATEWIGYATSGTWSIDGATKWLGGGRYSIATALTATTIVGTAAGDIGAAFNGFVLVTAVAGKIIMPETVTCQYTRVTASYTGGGNVDARWTDNATILVSATGALTAGQTFADADTSATFVLAPTTAVETGTTTLLVGATLDLVAASGFTQPGTAAGTATCTTVYNLVTP